MRIEHGVGRHAIEVAGQFGQVGVNRQQRRYGADRLDQLRLAGLGHAQAVADDVDNLPQLATDRISQQPGRGFFIEQQRAVIVQLAGFELDMDLLGLGFELQAGVAQGQINPHLGRIGPEQRRVADQARQGQLRRQLVTHAAVMIGAGLNHANRLLILLEQEVQAVALLQQALERHHPAFAPLALGAEFLLARLDVAGIAIGADQPRQAAAVGRGADAGRALAGVQQGQGGQCMLPGFLAPVETDQGLQALVAVPGRRLPRLAELLGQQGLHLGGQPLVTARRQLLGKGLQLFAPGRLADHLSIGPIQRQGQQQTIETIEGDMALVVLRQPFAAAEQLFDQQQ